MFRIDKDRLLDEVISCTKSSILLEFAKKLEKYFYVETEEKFRYTDSEIMRMLNALASSRNEFTTKTQLGYAFGYSMSNGHTSSSPLIKNLVRKKIIQVV